MLVPVLLTLVLSSLPTTPRCSEGPPPILQPADYSSPDATWTLHVDPSRRDGGGRGAYRMTRAGEVVWEKELAVTLWEAQVTDDGRVAGYAYSEGWRDYGSDGALHLVILNAEGELLLDEVRKREDSHFMHSPPQPMVRTLVAQGELDRMSVELSVNDPENEPTWFGYRLSDGAEAEVWKPGPPPEKGHGKPLHLNLLKARAIPGTQLTLVQWWCIGFPKRPNEAYPVGSLFTLVDGQSNTVWTHERRTDYVVRGDEKASRNLQSRVRREGAILEVADGSFDLWYPSEQLRASFEVTPLGNSWSVTLKGTHEYLPEQHEAPELAEVELEHLVTVTLRPTTEAPQGPIRDIRAFGFSEEGGLEFLRKTGDTLEFVRLDLDHEVLAVVELPSFGGKGTSTSWFDGGGNTWFASPHNYETKQDELHLVDVMSGATREIVGVVVPDIERLVATPSGGHVLLGTYHYKYTSTDTVIALDVAGKLAWQIKGDYGNLENEGTLFSPEDLAVMADGRVVVLDNIRDTLQVYSPSGTFLRTIELEEAWGKQPRYPTRLAPDGRGHVWIDDDDQLWRTSLDGELLETWQPRLASGAEFPLHNFEVSPSGTVWTTDRTMLASLTDEGQPGPVVGAAPSNSTLQEASAAYVDQLGRVLLRDARSGSWHVFDAQGEALFHCPLPPELEADALTRPSVDREGRIYTALDTFSRDDSEPPPTHCRFEATGELLGPLRLDGQCVEFQRRAPGQWTSDKYSESLSLSGVAQAEAVRLERLPNRRWWQSVDGFHLSSDGQVLVVLDGPRMMARSDGPSLGVFSADGTPRATIELPSSRNWSRVSTTNRWAAVSTFGAHVLLVDLERETCARVALPDSKDSWHWNFSPDGRELWGVCAEELRLERWALPED